MGNTHCDRELHVSLTLALCAYLQAADTLSNQHGQSHHEAHSEGTLGAYPATRDASGTSWQPDSTPMEGVHFQGGGFDFMLHGFVNLGGIQALSSRGANEAFTTNRIMFMGTRRTGSAGAGATTTTSSSPPDPS